MDGIRYLQQRLLVFYLTHTMDLQELPLKTPFSTLKEFPYILQRTTFGDIHCFWRCACRIKHEVDISTPSSVAPERLPICIHEFLRDATGINEKLTAVLWSALNPFVWRSETCPELTRNEIELFLAHGGKSKVKTERIGQCIVFYSPFRYAP